MRRVLRTVHGAMPKLRGRNAELSRLPGDRVQRVTNSASPATSRRSVATQSERPTGTVHGERCTRRKQRLAAFAR